VSKNANRTVSNMQFQSECPVPSVRSDNWLCRAVLFSVLGVTPSKREIVDSEDPGVKGEEVT
jgi:hypothetical protein